MKSPQYHNPPVSEVILGLTFAEPIPGLSEKDLWAFWAQIRDQFPEAWATDGASKRNEDEKLWARLSGATMLSMISEDRSLMLHLHNRSFTLKWKRGSETYPGYDKIRNLFSTFWDDYQKFCPSGQGGADVKVAGAILRYINIITDPEIWCSTADTPQVMPTVSSVDIGVAGVLPIGLRHSQIFSAGDETRIIVEVDDTVVTVPEGAKGMMVNITLNGELSQDDDTCAESWFEKSHDLANIIFHNTINDQAKTHWQKEATHD